jgi:uncharacterized membrane protein YagU involved in acid resistance
MIQDYQAKSTLPAAPSLARGGIGGFTGAIPMTLFMLLVHRLLPKWQQYALPPEGVTEELSQRTGIARYLNKIGLLLATLLAHFGYSSFVGMFYAPVSTKVRLSLPPFVKGSIFGLIVWAVGYLSLLPIMNMRAAGTRQSLQRNIMMVAAHLIWGSTTAMTTDLLEQ